MQFGVGIDRSLNLTVEEDAEVSKEAARLGYGSVWTPEGAGYDSFQLCLYRWLASCEVVPEGLTMGISVSPIALRTPIGLAMSGGSLSSFTGGRFILGIGSGGIYRRSTRRQFGLKNVSTLDTMRDYLTIVRGLVAGDRVSHDGPAVRLRQVSLDIDPPPRTPVFLGALGPKMLQLGGELADGVALNWCNADQVAWSRERIAEGARLAGRNPSDVKVAEYIRVCVDDDVEMAKRALASTTLGYALGQSREIGKQTRLGYRGHFERMGFGDMLLEMENMQNKGAAPEDLADAFPGEQLHQVGYFGRAEGVLPALKRLSKGLDLAIVRVVAARPGVESVINTMRACKPDQGDVISSTP